MVNPTLFSEKTQTVCYEITEGKTGVTENAGPCLFATIQFPFKLSYFNSFNARNQKLSLFESYFRKLFNLVLLL